MKQITLFFTLLLFISLNSCNNDDDNNTTDQISQLPPATQTGANTFGALLDGEPFIPSGGTNPLDCQYQLINGDWFFALQGNKRDEDFNRIVLSLQAHKKLRKVKAINLFKMKMEMLMLDTVLLQMLHSHLKIIQEF